MIRPAAFTGRERELSTLTQALADGPAVVLVEGEAGIGKTRLIREFLSSSDERQHRAMVAGCPPFRQPLTLGPIVDALRMATADPRGLRLSPLAGALRPLFPEWGQGLPPAPEPLEDATAARHRLFRALAEVLDRLGVAVLIVEDAHWADEATLEFALYQASGRPPPRSVVVTYRPEDLAAGSLLPRLSQLAAGGGGLRLRLGPLNVAGTARMVASMLGSEPVSAAFAAFLHAQTEGVPLVVEESVRLLSDRFDLAARDGTWYRRHLADIAVPPSVRDMVLERAARLSADVNAVLRAAAVLAQPAAAPVLGVVAGLVADGLGAALSQALASGLLTGDNPDGPGLISFRHVLAARSVYEAIPAPVRQEMHLRAGRALEGVTPLPVAALARHFRQAGDTGMWLCYTEQAVDLALASGDYATAAILFHDMFSCAPLPAQSAVRLTKKIPLHAFMRPGQFQDLAECLRSVLTSSTLGPDEEAQVRLQLGRVLIQAEDWNAGRAELERAIPHLEHDPLAATSAMVLIGVPRTTASSGSEHLRWLQRASGLPAPMAEADRLRFLVNRATALLMLGDESGWLEAAQIPDEPPTASTSAQITRAHLNIGDQAMWWGRHDEARRRLAKALELSERHQLIQLRHRILTTRIHLDWLTGDWDGLAERASALADDEDIQLMTRLESVLVAGMLHVAVGALPEAGKRFQAGLAQAQQFGNLECLTMAAAGLARLRLARGSGSEGLRVTRVAADLLAAKGTWQSATYLAPAHVGALIASDAAEEAERFVAAFADGLRGRSAPAAQAALSLCQAIVAEGRGEHRDAAAGFSDAADRWQSLPRPYDALLARERQAACMLALGEVDPALDLLTGTLRGLSRLGAAGDAGRVARILREHGADTRHVWRGGRRGYGDRLSPRELEVVRLAVTGRTNREIGQVLFRSPKTVSMQLSSAMRKLKVSSRGALAKAFTDAETGA